MSSFPNDKLNKLQQTLSENEMRCEESKAQTTLSKQRYNQNLDDMTSLKRDCQSVKNQMKKTEEQLASASEKLVKFQNITLQNNNISQHLLQEEDTKGEKMECLEKKLKIAKDNHMELSGMYENARARKQQLESELARTKKLREKKMKIENELRISLSEQQAKFSSFDSHGDDAENEEELALAMQKSELKLRKQRTRQQKYLKNISELDTAIHSTKEQISKMQQRRDQVCKEMEYISNELESL